MRDALRKHLELQPTSLIFFFMPDCESCKEITQLLPSET